MSLEIEDQSLLDKASEAFDGSQKPSKISYTREFLLSLSELEVCRKLPGGFDRSLLGVFEDTSHDVQEQPRNPGGLPLQGIRRGDYGSSSPTRGDSSNYSWGIYGRWDSRSSGRSDKESDSQSEWDTDSGRRYGNPSRRSGQSPEYDGLLGSGSFPRPSGYAAGVMAPKVREEDHYQLKKSNEPYHPPRPYKAVPHSRRETNDSFNDETFGSTECTSQDREEEERRRRVSFELTRKEQQKVLQEKQKLHVDKHKDDLFSDDTALLDQTKEGRALERNNELDGSGAQPVSNNDPGNSSFPLQTLAPRPLVPPGFTSTILEKNSGPKSLSYTHEKEIGKPELEARILHAKAKPVQNGFPDNQEERQPVHEMVISEQQPEDQSTRAAFPTKGEMIVNSLSGLEVTNKKLGLDDHLYSTSSLAEANEAMDNGEIVQLNTKKVAGDNIISDSNHNTTSILEKLFASSLTVNISSNFIEPHDSKPDATWSPNTVQSSKFARWFLEEAKKPAVDLSSGRLSDLFSLIVGGEKGGAQVSDVKGTEHIPPEFTYQSSEHTNILASSIPAATTGISEQLHNCNKAEAVPAVLTCEDLEQKIMSEYSDNSSSLQPPLQECSVPDAKMVHPKVNVDNHASLHLLSLLQKGTDLKDMTPSSNVEIGSSDIFLAPEVGDIGTALDKPREENAETLHNSGKNITLETLFGTAFMKELQSGEAPVSVHRSSVGSARTDVFEPHGLSFPLIDDGLFPSTIDEIGSNRRNYENNILVSNSKQLEKVENWLRFEDPQVEVESSKFRNEGRLKHGFDGAVENRLPEEESLITVGDPLNPSNSMFMAAGNSKKGDFLSLNTSIDVAEKLAALNAGYKDERFMRAQEGPPFVRGPYDLMESERQYYNLHAKASPPQFHSPQMSHGRPFFHPLDSHPAHITSQMKFMAPESIIQHDVRTHNQFPMSMLRPPFHHPNAGPTGFDIPSHHQMLQQMQMSGSYSPPNLLHEFPRGAPVPPHSSNQTSAFMQEANPIQGLPFGQRQPNISGLGMPLPAANVSGGSNHPEALPRLMGMELRANPKQVHPFGVGRSEAIYNQELEMGFRYR